jgi:peptidoglycan/xylan/chitin deacetylase (PgdA/CDA1 family)
VGSVVGVRTDRPELVLTYDDGPHEDATLAILDALDRHGATATFFILLSRARDRPDLVAEVRRRGHEVALHGLDHARMSSLSFREARARLEAGRAELEELSGATLRWYRPPYGAQTLSTWRAARATGLTPVLWGPSLHDWKDLSTEERLASALRGARPGAIVLAHDGFASERDGVSDGIRPEFDRGALADRMLDGYAAVGLSCRSLGDVLAHGRPILEGRFRR